MIEVLALMQLDTSVVQELLTQADLVQRKRYGPLLIPTRCTRHWNITKSHVVVEPMVP